MRYFSVDYTVEIYYNIAMTIVNYIYILAIIEKDVRETRLGLYIDLCYFFTDRTQAADYG